MNSLVKADIALARCALHIAIIAKRLDETHVAEKARADAHRWLRIARDHYERSMQP